MSTKGSVTRWIELLKQGGNSEAEQKLWERYYESLVEQARGRLRRGMNDEEDVSLQTFECLFRGLREGRFPLLNDRDSLWRLLIRIAQRKVVDAIRAENRVKRGRGQVQSLPHDSLLQAVAMEPTPEFAAMFSEELQLLLDELGDDSLQVVAARKMAGYSNQEIADELGCVTRTVERKLNVIRKTWLEVSGFAL